MMDTLDLSGPIERPRVKIDGKEYELLLMDDMTIRQGQSVNTALKKVKEAYDAAEELSDERAAELDGLVDKALRIMIDKIDDETYGTLEERHKSKIVYFWGDQAKKNREVAGEDENPTE